MYIFLIGEVYYFGLCGVDDIIRHLICMLQKPKYLWNMMRYRFSKNAILPHMDSTSNQN